MPSWVSENENVQHKYSSTELLEWKSDLYHFLGKVALNLDDKETQKRFLNPVFQLDDKPAASIIRHFLNILVCFIMDSPIVPTTALSLIEICIPHILQYRDWDIARNRDGRLFDVDIPAIADILLFVHVKRADNSARFANGDWRDINHVIPIIDRLSRQYGDKPCLFK